MTYDLPKSVEVCGVTYEIRSDFRAALDICAALTDPELDGQDRALTALIIFYPEFHEMPEEHYDGAMKSCLWFINCGSEEKQTRREPKLVDWEQDFPYIVAPVNRIIGQEIRSMEYLHWWTFVSAYYEIGDCLLAQIVRIRDLKNRGKPLERADREWYQRNRKMVDFKATYTDAENAVLREWLK